MWTESDLFPELDPPPGGLLAFRARLASDRRRRVLGAVALTAAIALLVLLSLPGTAVPSDPGLVAFGLYTPGEPVSARPESATAVQRVTVDETVVFYRVASLD